MRLRKILWCILALSGFLLILYAASPLILKCFAVLFLRKHAVNNAVTSSAIGIIGGSDGPTAVFVSAGGTRQLLIIGVLAVLTIISAVKVWRIERRG